MLCEDSSCRATHDSVELCFSGTQRPHLIGCNPRIHEMFYMELQPCMRGVASLAASPTESTAIFSVAVILMIESEHKLLCTHKVSCQPCKSKIAQLSWFRHHLTQPLHTELNVESSTGHVNADACILLIQLSFHLFQLVPRFWIAFPEVLATWGTPWNGF